ncbi:MAG TPA: DUF4194 domain-containing protein [Tepidisphaeraceae bacterium]|jgi:hypothetical protein|nr:DUF4194 domain-containing protein [Tepidisphaeraceae bacterium]
MSDEADPSPLATSEQVEGPKFESEAYSAAKSVAADAVPSEVKAVTQELLRYGYIEEAANPKLFQTATIHERDVRQALMPLDLAVRLDAHRGIALLVVATAVSESSGSVEAWSHPLVRRQRLTLEQSLLVAILRQTFLIHEQESGVGHSAAKIAVDDVSSQFLTYFDDSGSDARNRSRLLNLLDQLKVHGVVSEVDSNMELTIRPIIAHLANAEPLSSLLRVLKEKASKPEQPEPEHG